MREKTHPPLWPIHTPPHRGFGSIINLNTGTLAYIGISLDHNNQLQTHQQNSSPSQEILVIASYTSSAANQPSILPNPTPKPHHPPFEDLSRITNTPLYGHAVFYDSSNRRDRVYLYDPNPKPTTSHKDQ